MSNVTFVTDDSLSFMTYMIENNKKVDLIVTDPPYKVTSRGRGKKGTTTSGGMFLDKETNQGKIFENNDIDISDWLELVYNVLKDNSHCYIMTNNKNLPHYLTTIKELYFNGDRKQKFHYVKNLIWVKDNKIMSQTYMSQFEYIIMLRKGKHKRISDCGCSDVVQIPNKKMKDENGKTIHATEKPVELMEYLISNSSNEGDTVFDPFMGIGSTGIASYRLDRNFIGVEINDDYTEVARERWLNEPNKERSMDEKRNVDIY